MKRDKKPISLNTVKSGDTQWSIKMPWTLLAGKFTDSEIHIYSALDFLAGDRGWWYGEQDEIMIYTQERLNDLGTTVEIPNYSTSTFRRSIKRLRESGHIITERMTMKMNGILKYYVVARNPELPPRHLRT